MLDDPKKPLNRVISSEILSATNQLGNPKKSGLAEGLPQALKI